MSPIGDPPRGEPVYFQEYREAVQGQVLGQIDSDGTFHAVTEPQAFGPGGCDQTGSLIGKDCCKPAEPDEAVIQAEMKRIFSTGATRDTDDGKLDYEGFLSPLVLQEFAEYMHGHRYMKDGTVRDSDNWQNGFPAGVAEKSLNRHHMDLWIMHRMGVSEYVRPDGERVTKREALAGIWFNTQAIWLQEIKADEQRAA